MFGIDIPPPPISENAVKIVWAKSRDMFGKIISCGDGNFTFSIMKLYREETYRGHCEYYWHPESKHDNSMFDTVEKAEGLLVEMFDL